MTESKGINELRTELAKIDADLLAQFSKRMALAARVAAAKAQTKSPILVPEREQQLLEQAATVAGPANAGYARAFTAALLRLSRQRQYELVWQQDSSWPLGQALDQAPRRPAPVKTAAFPGADQSYSGQAAQKLYPGAALVPVSNPTAACRQVVAGNVDVAVLPLENSTAGVVAETYSLLAKHALFIQTAVEIPIRHALLGSVGAELASIRTVVSHPQALAQCSLLIAGMGWETLAATNTAFAAQTVKERQDPTLAALASPGAAAALGLTVLLPQASNVEANQTRFVAVGPEFTLSPKASRVSLVVETAHAAGALGKIIDIFADLELNLGKIQSQPIAKRPWEYSFYIDFHARPDSGAARRALYQIDKEAASLRLLGWYSQEQAAP